MSQSLYQKKLNKYCLCKKIIMRNLKKYNKKKEEIDYYKIQILIFHKKSHFTSVFIEHLIWDDYQEFLSEFYNKNFFLKFIRNLSKQTQINKNFHPTLVDKIGRLILFQNLKKKKILNSNLLERTKPTSNCSINNVKKQNIINNILPPDISGEKNIIRNLDSSNNYDLKSLKNESETIDNINVNNDISISLDLKINKKYDTNIIYKNSAFVKNKNGQNDKEIMKVIKFLKPFQSELIYKSKNGKTNNRNKIFFFEYLNDNINNKKIINKKHYYNNSSDNKNHKKGKIMPQNSKTNEIIHNNINNNIKRINSNSLHKKVKNQDVNSNNNKNIIKINIKKISPKYEIDKSKSKSKSRKKLECKNDGNNILVKKLNNQDNNINNKSKYNKLKNDISNTVIKKNEIKKHNKLSDLSIPFSALIKEKNKSNSNSPKNLKNKNKKHEGNDNKIKKIVLDKKIPPQNFIRREKYDDKRLNFISPDIRRKNFINSKKKENKLLIEKIIFTKKDKSFDKKFSSIYEKKYKNKDSSNKLNSIHKKKNL